MDSERRNIMIIGIGNLYRGDDGAGLIVARRIRDLAIDGLTVLEDGGEGAGLIDAWKDADFAIVIDAVNSGATPGTIHRIDATALPLPAQLFRCSTHAFGVAEAVELARELNRLPRRLLVYGIEGKEFGASTTVSEEVETATLLAVARVVQEVESWTGLSISQRNERVS